MQDEKNNNRICGKGIFVAIAWIDVETTGVDTEVASLLEISLVLTDDRASEKVVYEGPSLVRYSPQQVDALKRSCDRKVYDMHMASGLWDDLSEAYKSGESVRTGELDRLMTDFINEVRYGDSVMDSSESIYFGGNTVLLDRRMVSRDLPMVDGMLHYRNVDSSVMHTMASVNPEFPLFSKRTHFDKPHRALADVLESIEMYRYYRRAFGVDETGSTAQNTENTVNTAENTVNTAQNTEGAE